MISAACYFKKYIKFETIETCFCGNEIVSNLSSCWHPDAVPVPGEVHLLAS